MAGFRFNRSNLSLHLDNARKERLQLNRRKMHSNSVLLPIGSIRWLAFFWLIIGNATLESNAQEITVRLLYPANNGGERIYAVRFRNTSPDSIMVLHAQESQLPPFINNYKWEKTGRNGEAPVTVYLGRSDNPFLPEQYRATKTLSPLEELELYFRLRKLNEDVQKSLLVYFSMLSDRYANEFLLLEKTGTASALKRCKSLKQKHGVVHKRNSPF